MFPISSAGGGVTRQPARRMQGAPAKLRVTEEDKELPAFNCAESLRSLRERAYMATTVINIIHEDF
jgi:hypothetical protein